MAEQNLSNEQWADVLQLFTHLVDGAELPRVVSSRSDEKVRQALENLWRQHLRAEKLRFLEDQITVVSDLSSPGAVVFQPGQILAGRFAILRLLGRGGMGEVYLASDQRLMETVALKTVKRDFAKGKDSLDRFLSEVQNSRRVTHPNVCRIFDLFEHESIPFFSMEYIAGPTLAEILAAGPLNPERARLLAIQIAEALSAAHKNGILHCDLKPANILMAGSSKNERAVITDFGLAHALGRADARSETPTLAGTPPYMAPELLEGNTATVRTDIYAFGKVLDAMLPGNKLAPDCLAPEASRRPESMDAVLKQLRGSSSRRKWIIGALLSAAATSLILYDRSRIPVPLGSRQRLRVNGFQPESDNTAKIVRGLLIMALRQSPLLSVVGDHPYQSPGRSAALHAGFAFPLSDLLSSARAEKVDLVIDGSIETMGSGLRLVLNVYDPAALKPLYSTSEAIADHRGLVRLAELAANNLRLSAFGESFLHSTYVPLEQITSSSAAAVELFCLAVFYYEKSQANAALELIDQALNIDPGFTLAYHYRAVILTAKSMLESAFLSEEKASAQRLRMTERERNWIDGQYRNLTGNWLESAVALQKNTVLFPDEAIFQRQLAFSLMRLGRYDEAIPYNRRAVALDAFSDNNTHELVINLAEAKRLDECFDEVKKLEAAGNTPSMINRELALAFMQSGDYKSSLDQSRRFGETSAERASWSSVISLPPLIMQGRFLEAIQAIEGDLALDSSLSSPEQEQLYAFYKRASLGQLQRLKDSTSEAAAQAAFLVNLRPLGCYLLPIREGCALAFDLNEVSILEQGLDRLKTIAAKWPSSHSHSAVWLTEAMLKDLRADNSAGELYAQAKGTLPDPINLFYVSRWEGRSGFPQAQLDSLNELDRLQGKVYKYHFAGFVILGWLERAKCLQTLSDLPAALRMYQRAVSCWSNPQTDGSFMVETRKEMNKLQRRTNDRLLGSNRPVGHLQGPER